MELEDVPSSHSSLVPGLLIASLISDIVLAIKTEVWLRINNDMRTKMEIECVYEAVGDLLNPHRSVICCNAAERLLCVSSYNRENVY